MNDIDSKYYFEMTEEKLTKQIIIWNRIQSVCFAQKGYSVNSKNSVNIPEKYWSKLNQFAKRTLHVIDH